MTKHERPLDTIREALAPDYEVQRTIGVGSTATVHQAWEPELERNVAIKVLHASKCRDQTAVRRFEREAKAAAALNSPYVAEVHRFARLDDGTPYLVMQFIVGRTMADRVRDEGPLAPELALPILIGIASALRAAHASNIVHRDVRPSNILWNEQEEEALLVDFGFAALLTTSGSEITRLTRTGQWTGDARYLSPEQLQDDEVTVFSDIYSFGVTAYELLSEEGPYGATTTTQWIEAHLRGTPKNLTDLVPEIDPNVSVVLKRCLSKSPTDRPSASLLLQGLNGEWVPEPPKRPWVVRVAERLASRHVAAGFVVSGTVVGGTATLADQYGHLMPSWAFTESLVTGGAILLASAVVGWFHGGEKTRTVAPTEWALLLGTLVAWVLATVAAVR